MFVTPTPPGGVLVKDLKRREKELNGNNKERIKFEEKGGLKMKDILTSKNPFKNSQCTQKTCPLCNQSEFVSADTQDVKISCNSDNVGYRWVCITCKDREINKIYMVAKLEDLQEFGGLNTSKGLRSKMRKMSFLSTKCLTTRMNPLNLRWKSPKSSKTPSPDKLTRRCECFVDQVMRF